MSTWPRWRPLGERARDLDDEWRTLGRPDEVKAERVFWLTMLAGLVNNLFFCSLAFLLGHVVRLMFW